MKHVILFTALVLATTGCTSDDGAAGGGTGDAAQTADAGSEPAEAGAGETTSGDGEAGVDAATTDVASAPGDTSSGEDGAGDLDTDGGPTL
ncbi:MAG: hypothetical protein QF464_20505, partial [Myxococcota bacterium]|nr:hypothetical protein [Myxococcota bacterium]